MKSKFIVTICLVVLYLIISSYSLTERVGAKRFLLTDPFVGETIFKNYTFSITDSIHDFEDPTLFFVTFKNDKESDSIDVLAIVDDKIIPPYAIIRGYFECDKKIYVLAGDLLAIKKYFKRMPNAKLRYFTQWRRDLAYFNDGIPTWYYEVKRDTIKYYKRWYGDGWCEAFDTVYVRGDFVKRDSI